MSEAEDLVGARRLIRAGAFACLLGAAAADPTGAQEAPVVERRVGSGALAEGPIIDVHLHAYPQLPPADDPMWEVVPEAFRADRPRTVDEHRSETLAQLDENGIVLGIVSGPARNVLEAWKAADPDRLELGAWLAVTDRVRPPVDELRTWFEDGPFEVLGELTLQYDGVAFDDERLMPYYAMAEELGIPVGLHASGGPPGTPYFHAPRFRVSLGDPLSLEPVLLRFPDLKVYLMHAGHPFLDATKAILGIYPQVHVDTGVLSWALPRSELNAHLEALVDAGFGDRVMFGSDQIFWPSAIGAAVQAIREAPFLSEAQKRAIFYDNAARFLELPDSVRTRHHADARR